jgi:hypothetical protein
MDQFGPESGLIFRTWIKTEIEIGLNWTQKPSNLFTRLPETSEIGTSLDHNRVWFLEPESKPRLNGIELNLKFQFDLLWNFGRPGSTGWGGWLKLESSGEEDDLGIGVLDLLADL